ncbi:Uncharacterised protein [Mycobacteroides abscessus subsp. abscessus]|nr:Uncharacterised protein [Mycobacteroides abscessus subsp. abscessus]
MVSGTVDSETDAVGDTKRLLGDGVRVEVMEGCRMVETIVGATDTQARTLTAVSGSTKASLREKSTSPLRTRSTSSEVPMSSNR